MANTYVNKVVLGNGTTLIDLTGDDVTRASVLSGMKFHLPTGEGTTGTCTYDADTSDATATAAEILATKTAYKNGSKLTGTMPNNGGVTGTISAKTGTGSTYTIPQGYHDGSGVVGLDSTESAKLVPESIKSGVVLFGITGTYGGESISARTASATPGWSSQTILPGTGYDYLSQVDVAAIPIAYADNAAGGQTCTIG